MSTVTIGEALARRRLKPGPDSTGRRGYAEGQHHAVKLSEDDCLLSYVDRSGSVCIIPCERVDDEWFHRGVLIRSSPNYASERTLPRAFRLTDEMVRAIQAKYVASPPAGDADEENDESTGE